MPNYIDIKEFDGVISNADIEDLPDNVAQSIKNLKIQAGKLEKTFGAGSPSGVPQIGLTIVNSETGETYTVYNVFTFISDKFTGTTNEAGDGYRYLLVTIESASQEVKLFWWDSGKPDVISHLQIEDNILYFQTDGAHGLLATDKVLVQDCKDNTPVTKLAISGAGAFQTIDELPTSTEALVNTDNARTWGGSCFDATDPPTGASNTSFGGKISNHLQIDGQVTYDGTALRSISDIAVESMDGKVLCMATGSRSPDYEALVYYKGSAPVNGVFDDVTTSIFSAIKGSYYFNVGSIIGFNNAIYVHFSYQETSSSTYYNRIVKYDIDSVNNLRETEVINNLSSTDTTPYSYMYVAGDGDLYILIRDNGLWKIDTGDIAVGVVTGLASDELAGLTSITATNSLNANGTTSMSSPDNSHEYLFIGVSDGTAYSLYYNDILDSGYGTFDQYGTAVTAELKHLKKMDFKQNSNRSESIVIHTLRGVDTYLEYSTHNDTTVINSLTSVDTSVFTTSMDILFIETAMKSPASGVTGKFLMVGANYGNGPPAVSGHLYKVDADRKVGTVMNPGTSSGKTVFAPTCYADCVTTAGFWTYAKSYFGVYGTDHYDDNASPAVDSADIYRLTDIGWVNNIWEESGDCEYRWIYLNDVFDFGTHYHKKDRNPIVPFGDSIRLLTGSISKVGSVEAKGIWIGYIDRSIMNDGVTQGPDFFGYSNILENPFAFSGDFKVTQTSEELRDTDTVRYNIVAVYDGVQETLIEDGKELKLQGDDTASDEISKSWIVLKVDVDFTTLSKRITGFNIYRSGRYAGVWDTYKKVNEINFLSDDNSFSDKKRVKLKRGLTTAIYLKDDAGWLAGTTLMSGYHGVALGGNYIRAITTDSAIQGYAPLGPKLSADITDTQTTISVDDSTGLSAGQTIRLDDELITIGTVSSNDLITCIRSDDSDAGTSGKSHVQYTELRSNTLTDTGWFTVSLDTNIHGRNFNTSWKIFEVQNANDTDVPLQWNLLKSVSSGGYGGGYNGWVDILPFEDSSGNHSLKGWRDVSNNIDVSSLGDQSLLIDDTDIHKIYNISAWDNHQERAYVELDRKISNSFDKIGVVSSLTSYTDNGSSAYTIEFTDNGLISLGEHWGESVYSIRTNAQYAKLLKGRMFYANIVLDVGDKDEAQNDWIGYSELDAFDIRPVSNVIPFHDREGGRITGLAELFGRLIIFKPQAIFVLDVSNPSDPTSWTRKESKHNIGNIAPEGLVEVHDSVYFVHHDGIYRLDSNTIASSEATPSIIEKITLPIEDQFLLADSKIAVKGIYDQKNNELLFTWDVSSVQVVLAYHIHQKSWRKVDTASNLDILTYGENSGPICWDATDTDIKKFDVAEAVGIHWKSKRFPLSLDKKRLLRYGTVRFTGTDDLTVNVYLDGNSSVDFTKIITNDGGINKFPIKRYGKKFEIELTTASSTNTFFVEQLRIETE